MRKLGGDAANGDDSLRLQRNVSGAFSALMRRLDAMYAPGTAAPPADFRERIDHWHASCGMPKLMHSKMHQLRVWRNASEHHDAQRWRKVGPSEPAFTQLILEVQREVETLETFRQN